MWPGKFKPLKYEPGRMFPINYAVKDQPIQRTTYFRLSIATSPFMPGQIKYCGLIRELLQRKPTLALIDIAKGERTD